LRAVHRPGRVVPSVTLVITVALLKGGAGKSTVAVALAEAAALSVPAVLIDTDPMSSARRWAELAEASGSPLRAEVVRQASTDLAADVRSASRRAAVVVIDTPPPGALHAAEASIRVADQVVMPTPPRLADLDRVNATAAIAREMGTPAAAVLTMVRGGIEDAALSALQLQAWGVPVYASQMPMTVAIQRAYGQPVTSGPLLRFGVDLLIEITKEM
jgi:chromosome partitioning protein